MSKKLLKLRQQMTDNELLNIQNQRTAAIQSQMNIQSWPLMDDTQKPRDTYLINVAPIDNMEDHILITWHEEYKTHHEVHEDKHGILEMWKSVDVADKDLALAWMSTYIGKALKHHPTTSYEFVTFDYGTGTTPSQPYSIGGAITTNTPVHFPNTSTGASDKS